MSKLEYSAELVSIVKQALDEAGLRYTVEDDCVFRFAGTIRSIINKLNYTIIVDEDSIEIFTSLPLSAEPNDKEMMARVSEFICRVNYRIACGVAFQLDYRDGEISARNYIVCGECRPSTKVITNQIGIMSTAFKKYAIGFFEIIAGGSAEKAFIKCENSFRDIIKNLLADVADDDEIDECLDDNDDIDDSDDDDIYADFDIDDLLDTIDDFGNDGNNDDASDDNNDDTSDDSNDSASDKPVFRTDLFGDNQ